MDYFIPIVGEDALAIFRELCLDFNYAILPYYEVYLDARAVKKIRDINPKIKLILSSIMPDEYLMEKDILTFFLEYAEEIDADYLLVWDEPTYLDNYEESWRGTRKSIRRVEELSRKYDNIIPLIKGAYLDQISYSCSEIASMGYDVVAFHASQYLSTRETPWPEIKEYGLSFPEYLMRIIDLILEHRFKEIILIGGASPRHYKDFLARDDRIRLAGYSWFIDAKKYRLYSPNENIMDIRDNFYICNCKVCMHENVGNLRKVENIAKHNLIINKILIEDEIEGEGVTDKIETNIVDLILDTYNDLLILNDMMVGDSYSRWRTAKTIVEKIQPDYLLFTGDIIYPFGEYEEYREFIHWLEKVNDETKMLYLSRYVNPDTYLLNVLSTLYFGYTDILENRLKISDPDHVYERILKILLSAKRIKMKIRKYTWDRYIDIRIFLPGPAEKTFEEAKKDLPSMKHGEDWLITNYIPQPYIDREKGVATLGRWTKLWDTYEKPIPGGVYITRGGEVELIKYG